MLFWLKIFEDGHCPSSGLFAAPYLGVYGALINFLCKTNGKNIAFELWTGTG
jgi:hypothetical protein